MENLHLSVIKERFYTCKLLVDSIDRKLEPLQAIFDTINEQVIKGNPPYIQHPVSKTVYTELVKVDQIIHSLTESREQLDTIISLSQHLMVNIDQFKEQLKTIHIQED